MRTFEQEVAWEKAAWAAEARAARDPVAAVFVLEDEKIVGKDGPRDPRRSY